MKSFEDKIGKMKVLKVETCEYDDGQVVLSVKFNRIGKKMVRALAKERGVTEAELIREAIEAFVDSRTRH